MSYRQYAEYWLCTRDQFQTHRYGGGATETYSSDDDSTIDFYIREASRIIVENVLYQLPLPYLQTMLFDAPHSYEDGRVLGYDYLYSYVLHTSDSAPLLEVTTLTNGDGTTISSGNYVLYPANSYPKMHIRIKNTSTDSFDYSDVWEQALSVAGTWGYVPHYDNAWANYDQLDADGGSLTASATSYTFSSPADAGLYSAGDYIRINSEVIRITDTDTSTGVISLARGELGTTAATHAAEDTIERFTQNQQIMSYTAKLASTLYNRERGIYDDITPTPDVMLDEARQALRGHVRLNA